MSITLEQLRNELFLSTSRYRQWSRAASGEATDPFLSTILGFLDAYPETRAAYARLSELSTSRSDFCNGHLRSDGYYPLRAINEKIYNCFADTMGANESPDNCSVIVDIANGYSRLKDDFTVELTRDCPVIRKLLTQESCYGNRSILSHMNRLFASGEVHSVLAWLTVFAMFPIPSAYSEKKPDYTNLLLKAVFHYDYYQEQAPTASSEFLNNHLSRITHVKQLDMAFFAGAEWLTTDQKLQILEQYLAQNIPVRILLNQEDDVKDMICHMRNKNKFYVSLTENITHWKHFKESYPDLVQIRISPVPLLHNCYHIKDDVQNMSEIRMCFYTYGNPYIDKNCIQIFRADSPYYELYTKEFDYIWEMSKEA